MRTRNNIVPVVFKNSDELWAYTQQHFEDLVVRTRELASSNDRKLTEMAPQMAKAAIQARFGDHMPAPRSYSEVRVLTNSSCQAARSDDREPITRQTSPTASIPRAPKQLKQLTKWETERQDMKTLYQIIHHITSAVFAAKEGLTGKARSKAITREAALWHRKANKLSQGWHGTGDD